MDEVEEIKRRIDIVDFISSYLTLKKAGANYRAVCPFHNEKTPSLMISPEKQIFKCFGCNEGGDVFSFIMKMENLEFREALELLAQRSGVKLKKKSFESVQDKPDKKSRLFKTNALSAQVFYKILISHPTGKPALEYLRKRGLSNETIKEFLIGYAPSQKILSTFLMKHGISSQEIQNAGGPDRFFKRIIFPIRDVMGNVLGFTGRVMDNNIQPKYLNTPETIIFHKGRILFNLEKARGEIKVQKATVVVEGQMDVIASFQAGVKNVVATSGTALTPDHLQILYRYTPNIIFAFDSDTAGLTTAKKAYEMAISEGFNVKMVELGAFKDPGEMIAENPVLWQEAVINAKPVIDWYFNLAFRDQILETSKELTSVEKKEIAKEILPVIKKIPDSIEQAHYVGLLARKLGVNEQIVFDALKNTKEKKDEPKNLKKEITHLSFEDIFVGLLLVYPNKIKNFIDKITADDFVDMANKNIYSSTLFWYNNSKDTPLLDIIKKKIEKQELQKAELLILEIEQNYPQEIANQVLSDIFKRIKESKKENIKEHFAKEIKKAEEANDKNRLKELIKEFQDAISK